MLSGSVEAVQFKTTCDGTVDVAQKPVGAVGAVVSRVLDEVEVLLVAGVLLVVLPVVAAAVTVTIPVIPIPLCVPW